MNAGQSQRLKQLRSRADVLRVELEDIGRRRSEISREHDKKRNKLKAIEREIESLTTSEPAVTEHALLRYLERAKGIDLEAARAEILSNQTVNAIDALGSAKIPIGEGVRAVVRNRTVITVTTKGNG